MEFAARIAGDEYWDRIDIEADDLHSAALRFAEFLFHEELMLREDGESLTVEVRKIVDGPFASRFFDVTACVTVKFDVNPVGEFIT
jgi:hypothetical protein